MFRVAFAFDQSINAVVKALPYATYDPSTRSWTVFACKEALDELRRLHLLGLVDCPPDQLVKPGEELTPVRPAVLREGSQARPFVVQLARRDDTIYSKLSSIVGSRWDTSSNTLTYPPTAAAALSDQIERGVLDDPYRLLAPHEVSVQFDTRDGTFVVRGDERAAAAFREHFPHKDAVAIWQARGLDCGFADPFSEELYRGEVARHGVGIQPDGLNLPLYPYQAVDVAVAVERSGVLLGHSMGVGKTAVAIASGFELLQRGAVPRVVAVVPAPLRTQWRKEIVRFTGVNDDDVVVIAGTKKERMALWEQAQTAQFVVVHYDITKTRAAEDIKQLEALAVGSCLIFDEVHRCKNPKAKWTKVFNRIAKKASRRIGLSGTPIENTPGEFYTIMNLLIPGVFGSATDFLGRYAWPGRFGGYEGARNLDELRERSRPLYVRRTLAEVAEHLPEQRVKTIMLEPKPEYAAALKRAHANAKDEIAAARLSGVLARNSALDGLEIDEITAGAEMTAVGLLRLLCSSPQLILESDAPSAVALSEGGLIPDEDGPKVDAIREIAAELQTAGDRVVVFSSSKRMVNLVARRLDEDGIRYVTYTGDSSTRERDDAVAAFTTPDTGDMVGPTVFLSTDAGSEGLNLGRACRTLINLDLPWTPGRLAQRNARVRRVDSDSGSSFLVINLLLAGTLEAGLLRMVENKADLADAILGETGGRTATTGRSGRSIYETAIENFDPGGRR